MLDILAIGPKRITLSSSGRYRVVVQPDNETLDEVLTELEAVTLVRLFNRIWNSKSASMIGYDALAHAV